MFQFQKLPTFLKDSAIFIADSPYSKQNETLYKLLLKIKNNEIKTSQIFLVGDIFHLLLPFDFLIKYNYKIITLINELAKTKEIYLFEGNHDFCLKGIFNQKVKILKEFHRDGVCINHGDIYTNDKIYKIYSKIIRKKVSLKILNYLSLNFVNNWLFKTILNKKIKCIKIKNFQNLAEYKISRYNCKIVIEGHYHQNMIYKNYINLPSLFCQNSFLQLQNNEFVEVFI